jgi:hypothetical protein
MIIGEPYLDHYNYFGEGGFDSFVKKGKKAKAAVGKKHPVRKVIRRVRTNIVQKKNNVVNHIAQKKQNVVNNFGMMRRNRFAPVQNDPAVQNDTMQDDTTSPDDNGAQMDAPQIMSEGSSSDPNTDNSQSDNESQDEEGYDFFLQRRYRAKKAKKKLPVLVSTKKSESMPVQNTSNADTTSPNANAKTTAKTDDADKSGSANTTAADKKPEAPSSPGQAGTAPKTESNPQVKEKPEAKPEDPQAQPDVPEKKDSTMGLIFGFGCVALTAGIAIYAAVAASSKK